MKQLFTILFSVLFSLQLAAGNLPTPTDVIDGLKKGEVSLLAKYFDSSVDISLNQQSDTYSKSQATEVLKSFFDKHTVSSFKVLHNVDAKNGSSESIVGQLTANGKNYRVFLLMAKSGDKQIIQEISIKEK